MRRSSFASGLGFAEAGGDLPVTVGVFGAPPTAHFPVDLKVYAPVVSRNTAEALAHAYRNLLRISLFNGV
jgi:hypothetical protein